MGQETTAAGRPLQGQPVRVDPNTYCGSEEQWARWQALSAFCLECADGAYFISVCTTFDPGTELKLQGLTADFQPTGPETVLEVDGEKVLCELIERLWGASPAIEDPVLFSVLFRAFTRGRPVYCRTKAIEQDFRSLLDRLTLYVRESEGEGERQVPGIEAAAYIQPGPPPWRRPEPPSRERPAALRAPTPRRRTGMAIEPLPAHLKFYADRAHLATVESFSHADRWRGEDGFHRAHRTASPRADFSMICGFKADPGKEMWDFLLSHGEAAIKAHYGLWARLFEQTRGEPGQWAVMNINQFCADLGYKQHHKGGFRSERKREAMQLLELLTTIEIAVTFTPPGKNAKTRRIRGPLWTRGLIAEEQDRYADLFGQAREGDPAIWDPAGFTFGPGPWFADPTWRRQNRYLGLVGAGLMKLRADKDQTAIRIGGYLGALGRFEKFQRRRIRIATLLERIGMARSYPNNPGMLHEKVEEALNKLVDVEVLARWEYTEAEPDEPDMDEPEDLAALADYKPTPWRRRTVEIAWPATLAAETRRLAAGAAKAARKVAMKKQG